MSKLSRRVDVLVATVQAQRKRIQELETRIEVNTQVEYGESFPNAFFNFSKLSVPVIDVVNSILKHLELEISHKSIPPSTEAMVVFKPTKKKVIKRRKNK